MPCCCVGVVSFSSCIPFQILPTFMGTWVVRGMPKDQDFYNSWSLALSPEKKTGFLKCRWPIFSSNKKQRFPGLYTSCLAKSINNLHILWGSYVFSTWVSIAYFPEKLQIQTMFVDPRSLQHRQRCQEWNIETLFSSISTNMNSIHVRYC